MEWRELSSKQRRAINHSLKLSSYPSSKREKHREYEHTYELNSRERAYRSHPFLAIDGEGVNACGGDEPCGEEVIVNARIRYRNHKPGCQRYVLLMNSEGDTISNLDGLSTDECLEFLCQSKEIHPDHIHVIFGGSYDANMILKDLSYKHIQLLQAKKQVYWKNYRIAYIPRKYFQVSEYEKWHGDKRKRVPIRTVTLWDVIGFFQGSFVSTLEKYFTETMERRVLLIDEIKEGKARRSQFSQEELETFIMPYTDKEVTALVDLMDRLRENMLEAGIRVRRWDGAGAAAAALLRSYGVKKYYADLPLPVERAAQVAYGGGRIEILQYGHTDEQVFHYDLIGAYPSVMPLLPMLAGGHWIHETVQSGGHLLPLTANSLYLIYWDYKYRYREDGSRVGIDKSNIIYPFFYRDPFGSRRVFYPHSGYSWVWTPELEMALKHQEKLKGKIIIYEKYQFVPVDDTRPFAFVRDLYYKRLEYKAKGMGAELALKLAINSFYGKMAQTVGYSKDTLRKPPFYNLAYAGLVTSWTRARMFDAAMQNPEAIIGIATDGIWSLEPLHPPWGNLELGKDLGQWEFDILESMTSIQAGVYFATNDQGEQTHHYRGFNEGSITEDIVRDAWRRGEQWLAIPTNRFTTMGTAIASEERFGDNWRVWNTRPRILTIVPGGKSKRMAGFDSPTLAADELLPLAPSHSMYFEHEIHSEKNLKPEFLSDPHPLPWDEQHEFERSDYERMDDMDIIESEL